MLYFEAFDLVRSVYNYCTTSRAPTVQRGNSSVKTVSGANFVGEELYNRLCEFLKRHMRELLKVFIIAMIECEIHCVSIVIPLHNNMWLVQDHKLMSTLLRLQTQKWTRLCYNIIMLNGKDSQLQWNLSTTSSITWYIFYTFFFCYFLL